MAINKIALDGTTLIDLSTDTVASSDDIVQGKVGHLNDGSVVTGTATTGGGGSTMPSAEVDVSLTGDVAFAIGQYTSAEVSSDTTLTASINCSVGDVIICCFATRNCPNPVLSSGWTLVSSSNTNSSDTYNQRLNWAKKVATSTTESVTVTQPTAGRLYINLLVLSSTATVTDNGYTYFNTASDSFTIPKSSGITIWGVTVPIYSQATPYPLWKTSNTQILIQLGSSTQSRLLTSLDWSDENSVTFTNISTTTAIIGSLTVSGI